MKKNQNTKKFYGLDENQRNLKLKKDIINDLLCRWWYILPEWPPTNYNYDKALKDLGYVKTTWEKMKLAVNKNT